MISPSDFPCTLPPGRSTSDSLPFFFPSDGPPPSPSASSSESDTVITGSGVGVGVRFRLLAWGTELSWLGSFGTGARWGEGERVIGAGAGAGADTGTGAGGEGLAKLGLGRAYLLFL